MRQRNDKQLGRTWYRVIITRIEMIYSVNLATSNKSARPYEIPTEIIKPISEDQLSVLIY